MLQFTPVAGNIFYSDNRRLVLPAQRSRAISIARGHALGRKPSFLVWQETESGGIDFLVGVDETRTRAGYLLPAYRARLSYAGENFRVWCPMDARDISAARALLASEHPEGSNNNGMLVCLQSLNEFSVGVADPIGVALVGEIFHTNIVERDAFAGEVLGDDWLSRIRGGRLGRDDVVHGLHITGGKRYVIRRDRRGEGLGCILARHTAIVAATYRWPPADIIEVSRRMRERDLYAICYEGRRDFLVRSGYVPVPSWRWSTNRKVADDRPAISTSSRIIPGYYYKRVATRRARDPNLGNAIEAIK